jgi:lipoic acid synthetase
MDSCQYSWLDLVPYSRALDLQQRLLKKRIDDEIDDHLLLMEHPPVVTKGADPSSDHDFRLDEEELQRRGIEVESVRRGGHLTYHGPGQLVAYPIMKLRDRDIARFVSRLQDAVAKTLNRLGLTANFDGEQPGVWVQDRKICSLGLRFKRWVSLHGLALNVDVDRRPYDYIVPCDDPEATYTTLEEELDRAPMMEDVRSLLVESFEDVFERNLREVSETDPWETAYDDMPEREERKLLPRRGQEDNPRRKPSWLKADLPGGDEYTNVQELMDEKMLNTVCEEASCPNLGECWSRGTATFMILGDTCTRACGFCDVETGKDLDLDRMEPLRVANAVDQMDLDHTVITSVNRDDLPDGGAEIWANTIESVRRESPGTSVEVLIPDFMGDWEALETVFEAAPDILNHNVETVPRLYPTVRPQARYDRSLELLERSSDRGFPTKSGLMLGLGERKNEVKRTIEDLHEAGVNILTLGQYLRPSDKHLPVDRWVHPEEFDRWKEYAEKMGYDHVESGPQVRSSYHADEQVPSGASSPIADS